MRRSLLFLQLAVIALLALLHIIAITHFYYWRFRWLDIVAHFLGGLWAGLFAAWFLVREREPQRFLTLVVGIALLFGFVWEVFELTAHITEFPRDILDTSKDLSMDFVGGVASVFLARFVLRDTID